MERLSDDVKFLLKDLSPKFQKAYNKLLSKVQQNVNFAIDSFDIYLMAEPTKLKNLDSDGIIYQKIDDEHVIYFDGGTAARISLIGGVSHD